MIVGISSTTFIPIKAALHEPLNIQLLVVILSSVTKHFRMRFGIVLLTALVLLAAVLSTDAMVLRKKRQ